MDVLTKLSLVALGSALGGLSRWGVTIGVARLLGSALPWGTLAINIFGSFFLGWFMTVLTERLPANSRGWLTPDDLRLLVAIGFTGAFTTFSTFEYEAHSLFRNGESIAGTTYLIVSVVLGLIAVRLGVVCAN